MRRLAIHLVYLYFLSASWALAQEPRFARYYDEEGLTLITGGVKHSSGSFAVISNEAIACIDQHGSLKWKKRVWMDPLIVHKTIGVHQQGFKITAHDFNTSTIRFLIADINGNVVEPTTTVEGASFGEHTFIGGDSLLVTGQRTTPAGDASGFADLYDTNTGKLLWSYTSDVTGTSFTGGKRTGSGELAVFGMQSGSPFSKGYLTVLGTGGEEKWSRAFPSTVNASITDVEKVSGNRLKALLGHGESSDIITLDSNGDIIDTIELPHAIARKIVRVGATNKLIIAGSSRGRMFLTAMSAPAHFAWWRYFGSGATTGLPEQIRGLLSEGTTLAFFGGTRWDSQSRSFLIQTNNAGLLDDGLSIDVKEPEKTIPSAGTELQLRTIDFINDDEFVTGGQLYSHPPDAAPVVAGFIARLNSDGDTVMTKTLLSVSPWGGYTNNAITGVRALDSDKAFVHETGGTYGLYAWSKNALTNPIQIFTGKRSDFTPMEDGRLLFCFHGFDLQPYNEVGRLMIVDPNDQSQTTLPNRMVGSMIHRITPTGRGTYIIAGEQAETYKIARKALIAEINSAGVVLSSYTYDLGYKTTINAIRMKGDGNMIMAGAVEDEEGSKNLLVAEIDAQGTLLWSDTYDILLKDEVTTIEIVPGGYLIGATVGQPVFGFQESFGMVAFIGPDRKIAWQKFIGSRGRHAEIVGLRYTADSRILVVGNCEKWIPGTASFSNSAFFHRLALPEEVVHVEAFPHTQPQVYPNPFSDHLTIASIPGSSIELLNMHSQLVRRIWSTDPETRVDTSSLSDGVYILKIRSGDRLLIRRIVRATTPALSNR